MAEMLPVKYKWVCGSYSGSKAKTIIEHANMGMGYKVLQITGKGQGFTVLAAFRFPLVKPIPSHLTEIVDKDRIKKLEER